jgi:hypothetical protein
MGPRDIHCGGRIVEIDLTESWCVQEAEHSC